MQTSQESAKLSPTQRFEQLFYKLKLKFALGKFEIVYHTHGITFGKQSIENDRLVTNAIEM